MQNNTYIPYSTSKQDLANNPLYAAGRRGFWYRVGQLPWNIKLALSLQFIILGVMIYALISELK